MALADTPGSPAPEPSRFAPPRPRSAPAPPRQAELAVVVVNFCQWRNTARLTRQLRRSEAVRRGAAEVVIVDNHSPAHRVAGRPPANGDQTLQQAGLEADVIKLTADILTTGPDGLIRAREEARKRRDFGEADRIRKELLGQGVVLEDGPGGTTWRRA